MEIRAKQPPIIKHDGDFLRDGFLAMSIVGKSGCGKTVMLSSILSKLSSSIKTVLIATVVRANPDHIAIVDYFRKKGVFSAICEDPEMMYTFTRHVEISGEVSPKRQGLIVFDDFNTGKPTGPFWEFTVHAFTKLRNMGWNFIIIAQQPSFIPTIVRNCTTARVLFNCYSKQATYDFFKDFKHLVQSPSVLEDLKQFIQDVRYSYIMVQEYPFTISVGMRAVKTPIFGKGITTVPSVKEIKRQLNVKTMGEMDKVSKGLQKEAGNTSNKL